MKAPTSLSYAINSTVYTKGVPILPDSPANGGGVVKAYSVSPALPAGLTLGPMAGIVSGTPTTILVQANYDVTATNAVGRTDSSLQITVNDQARTALSYNPSIAAHAVQSPIVPTLRSVAVES